MDINAAVASEMVDGAAPAASQHARGVRVIHHHDAVISFGKIAERRQIGDTAVHGENPVGNQKLFAIPVFGFF